MRDNNQVKIYIINGMGTVGKDEFAKAVNEEMIKQGESFRKHSSVDWPKKVCEFAGWNGAKEEKDRKFISDVNLALEAWDNSPLQTTLDNIAHEWKEYEFTYFFVDIREPERIEKFKKMCQECNYQVFTVFIRRLGIPQITSNVADASTLKPYNYDYYLDNDGTLKEWHEKSAKFAKEVILEIK